MIKKTKIALGIATASLTMAGALVSPQAIAQTQAERVADATAKKTAVLEMQVNEMATMMQAMQAELTRVKTMASNSADTAKVQELDQWMASMKHAPLHAAPKDQMFSVRGGWMHMDNHRGQPTPGVGTDILTTPVDDDAFYYGGAIDFNMNNDLFGLMDGVSFGIELGIEYSELAEKKTSGLTPTLAGASLQQSVTVNMLRVSAAPKIKFMHGSKLRPWLIPVGLDFNIISPPSDAVTVLNTGFQFGAGVDYEVLPNIVLGTDARYHLTPDDVDGVDTDGFTVGGSVGFKF